MHVCESREPFVCADLRARHHVCALSCIRTVRRGVLPIQLLRAEFILRPELILFAEFVLLSEQLLRAGFIHGQQLRDVFIGWYLFVFGTVIRITHRAGVGCGRWRRNDST